MATQFPTERTVVVTGAGSQRGIGRAAAHRLARDGWAVGLIDIDADATVELAETLAAEHGVATHAVGVDVGDPGAVRAAIDQIETALPPIVGLANVAGVSSPTSYLELPDDEWDRVMRINLDGVHYVTQRVAASMVRTGVGRIVSISSASAQTGGGTYSKTAYSVAKAGLLGLTRSLARELGPHGVTVNAIAPGPIDTDIMGGTLTDDRKEAMVATLLVDRVGTTDDIASAIVFLLAEESGYITGQTINVNGGLYLQ